MAAISKLIKPIAKKKPNGVPAADETELERQRRRSTRQQQARLGRSTTILAGESDTLGP